jgi:hypothetical protein
MVRILAAMALACTGAQNAAAASDIVWTVENPFRLYKSERSFRLHEDAFAAVRLVCYLLHDIIRTAIAK